MSIKLRVLSILLAGISASATAQSYRYDDAGRLDRVVYANGQGVLYTYDARDNLARISAISVPRAAENLTITALGPGQAQLSWEHSGGGNIFLVQMRPVGTDGWTNGGSVEIGARTATVAIPFGQELSFRILVFGATGDEESAPSAAVRLPSPQPLIVNILDDENDHALGRGRGDSLREVVEAAVPGDVINFDPDIGVVYTLFGGQPQADAVPSIRLAGSEIVLDKNITIDASKLDGGVAVDAGGASRVFRIAGGSTVVLKGLAITGGDSSNGGGLHNDGGELTLDECLLAGNQSPDQGGAIYNTNGGTLLIDQCTIRDNSADEGGGIFNPSDGVVEVALSTIARNSALDGGGIYNRAASFVVRRSTLSGNAAVSNGGGIFHDGASGVIVNSTLHGNASGTESGGGVAIGGSGNLVLRHCTIAENVGAGVFSAPAATLSLDHTVVANNLNTRNSPLDVEGDFTAVGANLVRNHTGSVQAGPVPLVGDPILGPLGSYGGFTKTMPPLAGSPVIDAGVTTVDTPSTDQQNAFRPNGAAPDIGSIESRLSGETGLDWLTTSAGSLNPTFRSSRTDYTVTVENAVTTAAVRVARGQFGQTIEVRINGGAFSVLEDRGASADFPLNLGDNPIDIKVTAQNGTTTETYTLNVVRGAPSASNANLLSLSTAAGPLSPAFEPGVFLYHASVANAAASTTVTASTANPVATMEVRSGAGVSMPLNSGVASSPLPLQVGANAIDVIVTGADGTATERYSIIITREPTPLSNANLAALTTSAGSLSPSFSRGVPFYSVTVGDNISSVTVTATKVEPSAAIRVRANGGGFTVLASGTPSQMLALSAGVNLIEVEVTAPDGVTINSYTIIVTRVIDSLEWASEGGDNDSVRAAVSADCRFVAFSSRAENLVPDDSNNGADVFVYDRVVGSVERVSVNNAGDEGDFNGGAEPASQNPSISADGRFVAFQSRADNLVPDDDNGQNDASAGEDIFVFDRDNDTIERVSLRDNGDQIQQPRAESPSISADGRYVAFATSANNVVSEFVNSNNNSNVYVYDRTDGAIVGISVPFGGLSANRDSLNPSISGDGKFVAFEFGVDKSVDNTPGYQYRDIYLSNWKAGTVERITGTRNGEDADGTQSRSPSISHDGRYVAFQSNLENLDFYDTNSAVDVFIYDHVKETTRRVSTDRDGRNDGGAESTGASISGDGRYVAFQSSATNLVTPNTNGNTHIFLKDLLTGEISLMSRTPAGIEADGSSSMPSVSFDGRCVAFESQATNLGSPDANGGDEDVFVAVTEELAPSGLADLASLTSNLGAFSPGFSPGITSYSATVAEGLETAVLRPVAADAGAMIEARVNSGQFAPLPSNGESSLQLGQGSNVIDVRITAEDGSTTKTYSLIVSRVPVEPEFSANADLANLVTSTGALQPGFSSDVVVYALTVDNATGSIRITPTTADPNATLTVDGTAVASGAPSAPINLVVGSNTIVTTVTAEDGITTKAYATSVTRSPGDADLAILETSFGELSPAFSSGITAYSVNVSSGTTSFGLTPAVALIGATVTVNGELVEPGMSSSPIALDAGANVILVVVSSPDGLTMRTYTITVNRAAAEAAPQIVAFDLVGGPPWMVSLSWLSEPDTLYLLERSPDLTSWESLGGDRASTGQLTTIEVVLSEPLDETVFLRIRRKAP